MIGKVRWAEWHQSISDKPSPCACLYDRAMFFPYSHQPSMDEPSSPMDEPPSALLKSMIPRKTIIVDPKLWESFVYVSSKFEHHRPPCRFTHDEESRIHDLSVSSSKGNHLLFPGRCDIRAQHLFLWKTRDWFTFHSLRKSYTAHQYFTIPHIIHMDSTGFHWIPLDSTGLHWTSLHNWDFTTY